MRGRVARADAHGGAGSEGGGGPVAARRRLQAPHEPVRLPGPRGGGAADPRRRPRGDRAPRGHRGPGRGFGRPRGAVGRLHTGRRPQHAELLAASALRKGAEARATEARPRRDPRGVPDVGGVHPGRGELPGDPLRAGSEDVLGLLAQHARPRGGAGGEGALAPPHPGGPVARHGAARQGGAPVPGGGGGGRRRPDRRGASRPRHRAFRRPAVDHAGRLRGADAATCGRSRRSWAARCRNDGPSAGAAAPTPGSFELDQLAVE